MVRSGSASGALLAKLKALLATTTKTEKRRRRQWAPAMAAATKIRSLFIHMNDCKLKQKAATPATHKMQDAYYLLL
jgi:hypothetical protein